MRVRKDGVGVPELIYSLSSARNTHERDRPSGTAQGAAILRALRQVLDDEPKILADPLAARLLGDEFDRCKTVTRFFPWSARVRANFLMRSRYAEDCLAESLDDGVRHYVLLGAGWRLLPSGNLRGQARYESSRSIIPPLKTGNERS